jgi:predicted nucleotidyltransferase
MTKKTSPRGRFVQPYRYASPEIPRAAIRRFARKIAERFHPERIILFGSYAYGQPHEESDVDLLVIMPTRNEIDQSVRIENSFERDFALDLIVRTPFHVRQGLRDGDWFLREVMQKGIVLYETPDLTVDAQSRGRSRNGSKPECPPAALPRPSVLSRPAGRRKVSQSSSPRARPSRASDA